MTAARKVRASSLLNRTALVLYVAAQLCIALVTATEGRFGADARSHVEAAGISIHHAHDEATCVACAARALVSIYDRGGRLLVELDNRTALAASQLDAAPAVSTRSRARPRAPPLRQA